MREVALEIGARYDIEYVGSNLTLSGLEGALVTGTRAGPTGRAYEIRRDDGSVLVLLPELILSAELTAGE